MMNKFLICFTTCFLFVLVGTAQDTPLKYNKAIYMELGGNGVGITANFDMRIHKGVQDGLGVRAGLGGLKVSGVTEDGNSVSFGMNTIPISVNYLIGKKRHAFEGGLGITPIYMNVSTNVFVNGSLLGASSWGASAFLNMGYRFQPLHSGFLFRANWTPTFNSSGPSLSWFGLSLGWGFK